MYVQCSTVACGSCRHPERMLLRGGSLRPIEIPSRVGIITHPVEGTILFDAGYAPRLASLTRGIRRLYGLAAPFDSRPSAKATLDARGIRAEHVKHIIVSHLHPDHIGGLRDFPNATFHLHEDAWQAAQKLRGMRALLAGWFPELLPDDFLQRAHRIRSLGDPGYGPFDRTADLFGDGTLRLVGLPGHAPGQMGALLTIAADRRVLLAADAAWLAESIRERRPPSRITIAITHDRRATKTTLAKLRQLHASDPTTRIVLSHCRETPMGELR